MKTLFRKSTWLIALCIAVFSVSALAQMRSTVKGTCKDEKGEPMVGATIEMASRDSGQKYSMKTDKKGQFLNIGVLPGVYDLKLIRDGKVVFPVNNWQVKSDVDNVQDIDLSKELKNSQAAEATKKNEEIENENKKIENINDILKLGNDALVQQDFEGALTQFKKAVEIDTKHSLIFGKLGEAYLGYAKKASSSDERTERFNSAIENYKKAIDMASSSTNEKEKENIGPFYNNMGEAYAKTNRLTEAADAYGKAAEAKPAEAGMYYFNLGATMVNNGHMDEAVSAFDKCLAVAPNRAEAYYWKGVALAGKAQTDKDGKIVPLPGTIEALQKYLELKPDGSLAQGAKDMLSYLGSTVQKNFGKKK